ncbi:hypothetical protein ACFQ3Z_04320 [Streptomyces nogalater]
MTLPSALAEAVDRAARDAGVTRYVVLLAAFEVFLARMTGRSSVVLGTAATQRMRPRCAAPSGTS